MTTPGEPFAGPLKINAVVTAFHPDDRLVAVVEAARQSCAEVIVVDNTPSGAPSKADLLRGMAGVRVLRSGLNLGLAGGLNRGVAELAPDVDAVLLLDQDSVLSPAVVRGLEEHLADPTVGVAAPTPWDAKSGRYLDMFASRRAAVSDRDAVITSGMLVRRSVLDTFTPFREEFFVDHVDNDFCLRVRAGGVRIVQDQNLKLPHSLGERQEHRLPGIKVHTSRHPTWRLYWIARNAVILIREHRRALPRWAVSSGLYLAVWLVVRGLVEPPRRPRLASALRGLADGWRGRLSLDYLPEGAQHPARR